MHAAQLGEPPRPDSDHRERGNAAREDRDEAHDVANFYWEQEGFLKERAGDRFAWTIFRPQGIFGESFGSAMNAIVALGTYGAILREAGEPFHYPGGDPNIMEATDVDLLAQRGEDVGDEAAGGAHLLDLGRGAELDHGADPI